MWTDVAFANDEPVVTEEGEVELRSLDACFSINHLQQLKKKN